MEQALPDILKPGLSVVFCGINPGATAAKAGKHFVNGSNRFWKVLHLAGFTPVQIRPENDYSILNYGYGLTTAVARATRRASDLSRSELASAVTTLESKIAHYAPQTIAFLGKAAYSEIARTSEVSWGQQPVEFGGAHVWILPNPSGLNRSFGLDDLVKAYRELRLSLHTQISAERVV
jgi:TDG/mug DNA glycosylase family protein